MAQGVQKIEPGAGRRARSGYLVVDYDSGAEICDLEGLVGTDAFRVTDRVVAG